MLAEISILQILFIEISLVLIHFLNPSSCWWHHFACFILFAFLFRDKQKYGYYLQFLLSYTKCGIIFYFSIASLYKNNRNFSVSVHCSFLILFLQLYKHSSTFTYHGLLFLMFDIQVILNAAINQFLHMCYCIIGGIYLVYLPNSEIGCLKGGFIFL